MIVSVYNCMYIRSNAVCTGHKGDGATITDANNYQTNLIITESATSFLPWRHAVALCFASGTYYLSICAWVIKLPTATDDKANAGDSDEIPTYYCIEPMRESDKRFFVIFLRCFSQLPTPRACTKRFSALNICDDCTRPIRSAPGYNSVCSWRIEAQLFFCFVCLFSGG